MSSNWRIATQETQPAAEQNEGSYAFGASRQERYCARRTPWLAASAGCPEPVVRPQFATWKDNLLSNNCMLIKGLTQCYCSEPGKVLKQDFRILPGPAVNGQLRVVPTTRLSETGCVLCLVSE